MGKKSRFFQSISLITILFFGQPEPAFACSVPTVPCQYHSVFIEWTDSLDVTRTQLYGFWGRIGEFSEQPWLYGTKLYLSNGVGCPGKFNNALLVTSYFTRLKSYRIVSIDGKKCEGQKKYFLWVDTFRGNKGIFWGMFNGAPDGCTVVGAYIDGSNITRYKGNLSDSEVDFGYELIKSKEGYESPPLDFNKLPINYRDSNYEEYYFRANWVSPNCYWQVREVRRNSFGGIFDFLWNLFK